MKRHRFWLILLCAIAVRAWAVEPAGLPEHVLRGGLPNVFAKLKGGGEVRIAYLGGSITAQAGWRPKTLEWFRRQFPKAQVSEINAAIGGTGSDLGVFRLGYDVLRHRPDLLFVEFAVNDGGAPVEQIHRCMEGIARQTWRADPRTDVCFVYTLAQGMQEPLRAGKLPRSMAAMEQLAEHYQIPSINFGVEVVRLEKDGKLIFKGALPKTDAERAALGDKIVFSPDAVHPFPETGHQIYLEVAVRAFEKLRALGQAGPHPLKAPFVADNLEAAKLVPFDRARLGPGWRQLPATNRLVKAFGNRLPGLWCADQPGDAVEFRFRGTTAGFYDLLGPDCGQLHTSVDGGPAVTQTRFDSFCTYHRLGSVLVARGLPEGVHRVRVEIIADPLDKAKILARNYEKMDDPKRFEGQAWYVGALMLVGDLVE